MKGLAVVLVCIAVYQLFAALDKTTDTFPIIKMFDEKHVEHFLLT